MTKRRTVEKLFTAPAEVREDLHYGYGWCVEETDGGGTLVRHGGADDFGCHRHLGRCRTAQVSAFCWLVSKATRFAVSHLNLSRSTAKKDHELLQSASILGLVAVREVSRESRVRAGQVFRRLFLAATEADLAFSR